MIDVEKLKQQKAPGGPAGEKGAAPRYARLDERISAMRICSILGRFDRPLASCDKVLRALGIVTGQGKSRKGPTADAVKMRWAMGRRGDCHCPKSQQDATGKATSAYWDDVALVLNLAEAVKTTGKLPEGVKVG